MIDSIILLFLLQDGVTNGAIYALLGLALVLVFTVTRVIFIPQGEFVAYGALSYALLETGRAPGTIWLLLGLGMAAFVKEAIVRGLRLSFREWTLAFVLDILLPLAVAALVFQLASKTTSPLVNVLLTLAMIAPLGPYLYRIAFQPIADSTILTLFTTAIGVHLAMTGLGLAMFGAEGLRAQPLLDASISAGPVLITGQNIAVYVATLTLIIGLWAFFERSLYGKALRATAINRIGARLVGVRASFSGSLTFFLAAVIGAISGILIVPMTTVYYDSGFLIGLKGFVAAIIGALASYPATALAAIFVGIAEAFASFYASAYKEIIVFMLIVPVLVWRSLGATHDEEES